MKGIVFSLLEEYVVESLGMEPWNEAIETLSLSSGGIYTAGETYDDAELFSIVGYLVDKTATPLNELVRGFGAFMFPKLVQAYPVFVAEGMTLFEFLKSIDDVIHVEVRKLYKNPGLPSLEVLVESDNCLTMAYYSKRKLCHLAEGLIAGAAEHFNEPVAVSQTTCLHEGDDRCILVIEKQMH